MSEPLLPMEVEDPQPKRIRPDIWVEIKRWAIWIAIGLSLVLAVGVGIALVIYGPKGLQLVNDIRRPYQKLYAAETDETAVVPFIGDNTLYDVAVTIFQREECSHNANRMGDCPQWDQLQFHDGHPHPAGPDDWKKVHIPEKVVYSGVVMEGLSLAVKDKVVNIEFDLPVRAMSENDFFRTSGFAVRAAVTVFPQAASLLNHVSGYATSTPDNMISPTIVGDDPPGATSWGEEGSLRRRVLDGLTVHVPLLRTSYGFGPRRTLINSTQVFIMNESHPMERNSWLSAFDDLRGSNFCEKGPPIASWIYCGEMYNRRFGDIVPDYYRTKAHFLGQYELDGTGGIGEEPKIAYNPYMSFMGSDPGDRIVLLVEEDHRIGYGMPGSSMRIMRLPRSPDQDAVPDKLKIVKANLKLQFSVFNPTEHFLRRLHQQKVEDNSNWYRYGRDVQESRDYWAFSSAFVGNPIPGANSWRRIGLTAVHKVMAFSVAILSIVYWYTRRTAAGISHWSIWVRVLVVVPKAIHWVCTSDLFERRRIAPLMILAVVLQCVAEFYQLRLVIPFRFKTKALGFNRSGSKWWFKHTIRDETHEIEVNANLSWARRKWSHRERASMRLEPEWKLAVGTFVGSVVFYIICRGFIIAPPYPLPHDRTEGDALARFVKALGWSGFFCADLLQVRMNYYSETFAGTYALVACLRFATEVCELLYNSSAIMGKFYAGHGLSLFQASRALFALVIMCQALIYPKVVQVSPEDDEE